MHEAVKMVKKMSQRDLQAKFRLVSLALGGYTSCAATRGGGAHAINVSVHTGW